MMPGIVHILTKRNGFLCCYTVALCKVYDREKQKYATVPPPLLGTVMVSNYLYLTLSLEYHVNFSNTFQNNSYTMRIQLLLCE